MMNFRELKAELSKTKLPQTVIFLGETVCDIAEITKDKAVDLKDKTVDWLVDKLQKEQQKRHTKI